MAEHPVVRITKEELTDMFWNAKKVCFWDQLKEVSKERGLIYSRVRLDHAHAKKGPGFRTWFEPNGDFCQQNFD